MNGFTCRKIISVLLSALILSISPLAAQAIESPYGDYTSDGTVNAQDAALLLQFLASEGSGTTEGSFSNYLKTLGITLPEEIDPTGLITGDANIDHEVNANDAAFLLEYTAAVGIGYEEDLMTYANEKRGLNYEWFYMS